MKIFKFDSFVGLRLIYVSTLAPRKVHVIFLSFRVQILQIDNTSEEEGSLQYSCLVLHHALGMRKVHVVLSQAFRVQIFQIDITSEEEGSLQYSCLVSRHALRTGKVHVIFLSFRVLFLQMDNTTEEEGSLQYSCLVSYR